MCVQRTDTGKLTLALGKLQLRTDGLLNGASGFGHFPLRVDMVAKPTFVLSGSSHMTCPRPVTCCR